MFVVTLINIIVIILIDSVIDKYQTRVFSTTRDSPTDAIIGLTLVYFFLLFY